MPAKSVIEVRDLGKRYRLGQQQAAYGSLRDSIAGAFRPRAASGDESARKEMWALRDVDFTVHEGEALGIVGTNGAGKSTLLRILSRITEPTTGVVRTRGRVGVMLEVGTGFHPELTGRENVFLSGAVMGMTRRDIRRHYDDIVAFAGVERFLETPLKRYSSGMQLRLAFAVAAHLEPELMLVDEVLAVGDVEFQRRCMQRMGRIRQEGRTVIFVSHDLGAVTRLCTRAIWMDGGRIVADGDPGDIIQAYYAALLGRSGQAEFAVDGDAGISHVALVDDHREGLEQPTRDQPFTIQVRVVATKPIPFLDLGLYLTGSDGTVLVHEVWSDQPGMPSLAPEPGEYLVRLRVPPVLRPDDYVVGLWLGSEHTNYVDKQVLRFALLPKAGDRQEGVGRRRVVQPPVSWTSELAVGAQGSS